MLNISIDYHLHPKADNALIIRETAIGIARWKGLHSSRLSRSANIDLKVIVTDNADSLPLIIVALTSKVTEIVILVSDQSETVPSNVHVVGEKYLSDFLKNMLSERLVSVLQAS